MSPVRWGAASSGSTTIPRRKSAMMISFLVHVAPWSVERIAAMLKPPVSCSFLAPRSRVKTSSSSPLKAALSGRTTTRLPIVWAMVPALKIFLAGSQLLPPLVVRAR
jgi:hypothetical protein